MAHPENDARYRRTLERKALVLELVGAGVSVYDAIADRRISVTYSAYRKWRERDPKWAAMVDVARAQTETVRTSNLHQMSSAQFCARYFNRTRAPFQQQAVDAIKNCLPGNMVLLLFPPEHGKELDLATVLPTPEGWTTMGAVEVGDMVIAADGTPTRVVFKSTTRIPDRAYRVTFADGSSLDAGGEHQWVAGHRWGDMSVVTTDELAARPLDSAGRARWRIPAAAALDLPAIDVPCDPWFIGYWLGDGARGQARISTAEPEVLDAYRAHWIVTHVGQYDYSVSGNYDRSRAFRTILRKLDILERKAVPAGWLRASYLQRLALLQGWMDADGSCSRGQCELACTDPQLMLDAVELVRSLGLHPRRYGHRLSFYTELPVFRLQRKSDRQTVGNVSRRAHEVIADVVAIPSMPMACITVDHPSGTYLAGPEMHVTHNTTTFEDHATESVVRDPQWRSTVASENQSIAKKIVGRVRGRLEPDGPCPNLVKEWGPFRPDAARSGGSNFYQPWNDTYFNVRLKKTGDERDYNMYAIGVDSSTVSIRTDQLHIDDPQSQKTVHRTPKLLNWFRSDGLTRPGDHGRTSIAMTRAGEDDFACALEDDEDIADMLTVVKFRAIVKNPLTGEDEPLWPQRYSLDSLDRIRRKIKDEAFERNYMMTSGVQRTKFGFSDEGRLRALDESRRLGQLDGWGDKRPSVVLALDPGLAPGICCLQGWAMTSEAMHLVHEDERADFVRNEEIIDMIDRACARLERGYKVAHLVIEAANFQRGLARDERLMAVKRRYGFTMGEHQTNANKYDDDIGVASMAGDWEAGKIRLPYDPTDERTRDEIDELCKQLRRWKPLVRGNKQRMDRVMAMWFAWIYWQQQRTMLGQETVQWRRTGIPWAQEAAKPQLIIPIGVTV